MRVPREREVGYGPHPSGSCGRIFCVTCAPKTTLPPMIQPDTERALRTAGRKVSEWIQERDRLVKEARDQGGSLREIAELVGLSHQAVKFICEGRPPR